MKINYEEATFVNIYKFVMDKLKEDGTMFKDRAFSNVYVCKYEGDVKDFNFDDNELSGLVRVNAKEALKLFEKQQGKINGTLITKSNNGNKIENKDIFFEDFLVNSGETALAKYGDILNKVIELTR